MNDSMDDGCPVFEDGNEIKLNEAARAAVETLYSLVSLLAVGGNGIVIYIVIHFRRMRSATNYFIVNLAIAGRVTTNCFAQISVLSAVFFLFFFRYTHGCVVHSLHLLAYISAKLLAIWTRSV